MINTLLTTLEYIAQIALFTPLICFIAIIINIVRGEADDDSVPFLFVCIFLMLVEYMLVSIWQEGGVLL